MDGERRRVLVLCTGNSCRSQMAEGWINHLLGDRWEACPTFPRPVPKLHLSFSDPAEAWGPDEEKMAVFRRVRDDIRERLVPEVRRRT
jgi:protein-tyrosine-phosphatase